MPDINAFQTVVDEKKFFKYLSSPLPLKGSQKCQALYFNKSESPSHFDASYQIWLKLTHLFLKRRCFHEKIDRRTVDAAPSHKLSWPFAR